MIKFVPFAVIVLATTGCATQEQYNYQSQYCYTDQTITQENGTTVSSRVVLECTDRPGQQIAIARAGIDEGCKEFWYDEVRQGKRVKTRGIQCEKPDGTWEVLNINGTVR